MGNVLKFVSGVPDSKLNCPPNNCMPRRANIRMNKKSRNNNEMMDLIEFNSEITRFRKDDQYLVTLNIRSKRRARSTDRPNEPPFNSDQITSNIEPLMTTQSKRLNDDSKYMRGPKAYILMNISDMKRPKKKNSAKSVKRETEKLKSVSQ